MGPRLFRYSHFFILAALLANFAWAKRRSRHEVELKSRWSDENVAEPSANEVCFSPEEECGKKLVRLVGSAHESLDIAVYDINLDQLVDAIIEKSHKIPVRMIVDRRQSRGEKSAVKKLSDAGVHVRVGKQKGVMHNKFIIVDGKKMETGSFNYTRGAHYVNQENQIFIAEPAVVEKFRKRFAYMWSQTSEDL